MQDVPLPEPRSVFNKAARDYDAVRPGYPDELYRDVIRLSGIPDDGRILEVGCGTGQATIPLAERGYRMLCLDIGGELLAIAREKCRGYPNVDFMKVSFEDWEPEPSAFNLLISATAFHWVDPEVGYPKAAQILVEDGCIALFWNMHPTPYTGFFSDVQEVYRRVVPEWGDPWDSPTTEERIRRQIGEIDATSLFGEAAVRSYRWSATFDREGYLRLLDTFSDHGRLEEHRRAELYAGIGEVIDERYGGSIERPYISVLYVARKKVP